MKNISRRSLLLSAFAIAFPAQKSEAAVHVFALARLIGSMLRLFRAGRGASAASRKRALQTAGGVGYAAHSSRASSYSRYNSTNLPLTKGRKEVNREAEKQAKNLQNISISDRLRLIKNISDLADSLKKNGDNRALSHLVSSWGNSYGNHQNFDHVENCKTCASIYTSLEEGLTFFQKPDYGFNQQGAEVEEIEIYQCPETGHWYTIEYNSNYDSYYEEDFDVHTTHQNNEYEYYEYYE